MNRSNNPQPADPLPNEYFILLPYARVKAISITFFLVKPVTNGGGGLLQLTGDLAVL